MLKRGLLNMSGFVFSIASPLVPIIMNWDSLINKNAWTAISVVALFIILACVAVFNLIFKGSKLPIKANKLWLGGAILLTLLAPIIDKLALIFYFGTAGSVVSGIFYKLAENSLTKQKENKLTDSIVEKLAGKVGG